jgi:hypothetical protein
MVQKRATAALRISDEKLAPGLDPDLGMGTRDDFGFEGEFVGAEGVDSGEAHPRPVGETPDAERGVSFAQVTPNGIEAQGASRVEVGD